MIAVQIRHFTVEAQSVGLRDPGDTAACVLFLFRLEPAGLPCDLINKQLATGRIESTEPSL